MKNFVKKYAKLKEEQECYVNNIKNIIFKLLELRNCRQTIGGCTHGIYYILPEKPQLGMGFYCETNGTRFTFNVRVKNGYIEAFGTIPGPAPVRMVSKKWYSIKKLEKEFIKVFGECFYESQSVLEMLEGKLPKTLLVA